LSERFSKLSWGWREGERESERDRRGREKNDEHDDDIVDEGCITIK
jgi:hypothetical protein